MLNDSHYVPNMRMSYEYYSLSKQLKKADFQDFKTSQQHEGNVMSKKLISRNPCWDLLTI